jgi:UDP-N-acetylmuramoyl-L-alanyl-D-glutamate--2,6-diaminopimelate ligase
VFNLSSFPKLILKGEQLIWDYRQKPEPEQKLRLFLREFLSSDQREKLLTRFGSAAASVVDETQSAQSFAQEVAEALGNPSHGLKIVGVTGSNGKTSTVALASFLLARAGMKTLSVGTLGLREWQGTEYKILGETGFTSPDAPLLQSLLAQARDQKFEAVVMEVSSHALALGRVGAIAFDVAAFTNLSRDHLDFHGSMESYAEAKKSFFTEHLRYSQKFKASTAVLNRGDAFGDRWISEIAKELKILSFRLGDDSKITEQSLSETTVEGAEGRWKLPLVGAFNVENALCALAAARALVPGLMPAFEHFPGIPGRLELLQKGTQRYFVDYAHTPDALEKALALLASLKRPEQKLWCLFGCGGDRDPGKRPMMGAIAARLAERIVLTSDNPRFEDPHKILDQIEAGIAADSRPKIQRIENRREALRYLTENLGEHDIALVAGKGPENYQIIGDKKHPFDDKEVLRELTNI